METTAKLETLESALEIINKKYADNVIWNREPEKIGNRYRFTLKVKDSKQPGHRRGFNGQRMVSACWHVHGDFFDTIWDFEPEAKIKAGTLLMESKNDNWQDRNIGSVVNPMYFSEACDC
jgi:hypothetical protein